MQAEVQSSGFGSGSEAGASAGAGSGAQVQVQAHDSRNFHRAYLLLRAQHEEMNALIGSNLA